MLVWEILLGTERAQKGARPIRSAPHPHPETPAGKGVFLGRGGGCLSLVPSKWGEKMEYEVTKDWERRHTAGGMRGERGGGWSGPLWRPVGGSREEASGKP